MYKVSLLPDVFDVLTPFLTSLYLQAFNTFIDDVFEFLIVMPTSHRIAVFRDDLVFLVYLHKRW